MGMSITKVVTSSNELEESLRDMSFPYKACLKLKVDYWGIKIVRPLPISYLNEYILVE